MVPGSRRLEEVRGSFLVGSDFSLVGCNFTQCQITGNWVLALIPEPSSLASLASALLGVPIAMLLFTGRRNAGDVEWVGPGPFLAAGVGPQVGTD